MVSMNSKFFEVWRLQFQVKQLHFHQITSFKYDNIKEFKHVKYLALNKGNWMRMQDEMRLKIGIHMPQTREVLRHRHCASFGFVQS